MSWKSAGDSPNCSERPGGDVWREQRVKVGSRVTGPKVGSQMRCFSLNKTEPLKTEQSVQMLSPHSGTSATGVFLFSNHFSLHILSHQWEAQLGTWKPLKNCQGIWPVREVPSMSQLVAMSPASLLTFFLLQH